MQLARVMFGSDFSESSGRVLTVESRDMRLMRQSCDFVRWKVQLRKKRSKGV